MQQPPELQFLELIRQLNAELPQHLKDYQADAYRRPSFGEQPNHTDQALAIFFHHIAFETFSAFERVRLEADGAEGGDFPEIKSPVVRNFWSRVVEQRTASRDRRAAEILNALTEEDRRALIQAGVRFPSPAKPVSTKHRSTRNMY